MQDRSPGNRVALLMMDMDHFKTINDNHGHNQGDIVLRRMAAEILDTIRSSDIPVRLGGDELAIFVVGDAVTEVMVFAERLRARIAALHFLAPMKDQVVTVSIGVAIRQLRESLLDLIQRADMALYDAKNSGRNRVRLAPGASPLPATPV